MTDFTKDKAGMILPLEDANTFLNGAMEMADKLFKHQGGLDPMLEVITLNEDKSLSRVGVSLEGDFDNHTEKLRAMVAAARLLANKLSGSDAVPLQVTLMSEAWKRRLDSEGEIDEDSKVEVLVTCTRTWDGREGSMSRRIVRDTDDTPLGTMADLDSPVTEKTIEGNDMLGLFFTAFAAIGAQLSKSISPALQARAREVEEQINQHFN